MFYKRFQEGVGLIVVEDVIVGKVGEGHRGYSHLRPLVMKPKNVGLRIESFEYKRQSSNPFHNPHPTPSPGLGHHPKLESSNVTAIT